MDNITEKVFEYNGFPCLVSFTPGCWRCGYVGVPEGHVLYGMDYHGLNEVIDCHGGVTYTENYVNKYKSYKGETYWWIGFDCAHAGDGYDFETGRKYYKDDKQTLSSIDNREKIERKYHSDEKPVTLQEVVGECISIVEQIKEIEAKGITELDILIKELSNSWDDTAVKASKYLEKYRDMIQKPLGDRIIDVLREVRGE